MNRTARNVVIVLAIAALVALVQGGQTAANVALQALSLVFLGVIVFFLSIIYRQYRTTLYGLGDRRRAMLYVALGVGTLTLTASSKLWATGAGSVVWVLLLAAATTPCSRSSGRRASTEGTPPVGGAPRPPPSGAGCSRTQAPVAARRPDPILEDMALVPADRRRELPDEPGVYLFRDQRGKVIYVGKAKSIRKRVASHFSGGGRGSNIRGGRDLLDMIDQIEALVVHTEAEALLAEQNFIKQYKPRFNIRLRDDKSYPYIGISLDEDFPRVYFTRERHRRDRAYFGPYSNAKRVRSTLEVLGKVFMFRSCEGPEPGRRSGSPCLDYYIKRCEAPCVGYVSTRALPRRDRRRDRLPVRALPGDRALARAVDARGRGRAALRGRRA